MDSNTTIGVTSRQLRAARALLGWTREEAAAKVGVGPATLSRLERELRLSDRLVAAIVGGFEDHGIIFFNDDGGLLGVALAGPRPED